MYYKIVAIKDLNGEDKKEQEAVNRIGRVISVNPYDIELNCSVFLECVYPSYFKSIITSHVTNIEPTVVYPNCNIKKFIMTTENSKYYFEETEFNGETYSIKSEN